MKKILMALISVFLTASVSAAEMNKTFYTDNFFIFLTILGVTAIVVGIFMWLWIRGPVNRFKK